MSIGFALVAAASVLAQCVVMMAPWWARTLVEPAIGLFVGYIIILIGVAAVTLPLAFIPSMATPELDGATILVSLCLAAVGFKNAGRDPIVREHVIRVPRLFPHSVESLRVAVFGDLHQSPIFPAHRVRQSLSILRNLRPDFVLCSGDLFEGSPEQLGSSVAAWEDLKSATPVYFVLGNHDHYHGFAQWKDLITKKLGWKCVEDNMATANRDGFAISVVGTTDREHRHSEVQREHSAGIFGPSMPKLSFSIAHHPGDLATMMITSNANNEAKVAGPSERGLSTGEVEITPTVHVGVSGHTHAGQFWPITMIEKLIYAASGVPFFGMTRPAANQYMIVHAGVGHVLAPYRLGSRAEIVLLRFLRE